MSSPVIKLKRGAFADLPTLSVGEPGFTTDRYQLYVGSSDGNKLIGGGEFWNLNSTTAGGGIKLYEATNNGTNFVELKAPDSIASNETFVLPGADGAADTVLKTDGSGNLTFVAVDTLSNAGLNNVVEDTSPQLGGNLDLNSSDVTGTGNVNISGNVTASGDFSVRGGNVVVNSTGVNVSGTLTATNLSGALNTSDLSGTITNAQLGGSISDDKLNQITTADKVAVSALDINGATDIGAAVVDADLFIVDDGAGGTNRKTTASRIKSYVLGGGGGGSSFDSVVVGSATTINDTGIDAPTGIITASSFVGDVTGTADKADTVGFAPELSSSSSHFITFAASADYASLKRDSGLTYVPNTNTLTAGAFVGNVTGDVTGNATSSDTVDVTDDDSTNTSYNILFTDGSGSGKTIREDSGLIYNPAANTLTTSEFVGDITGDVTGNLTGTVQTASQTNITSVGTLGSLAVTNNITVGGTVDGRDIASDGTNQDALQTLSGVSAGSTTLGTFTGSTISDNKNTKGALQELETALDSVVAGNTGAATILTQSDSTDASFFPTFVSDNNGSATQESLKTDAGISYNPSSNLLTVTDVSGATFTASGDITANGNIVGDNSTNITGINQVTATTFVGALTGISTGTTRVNVSDVSSESAAYFPALVNGEGYQVVGQDDGLYYTPSSNVLTLSNAALSGYIEFDGAGVQVDGFTDEDNMASNSATKLPTQQSVKAYVDTEVGNITSTITLNADSTAGIVTTGNTLSVDGTANEIETSVVSDVITIGLPASVVVTTELEVPTLEVGAIQANDGTASMTVANSTGKVTAAGDFEVQGATTVQALTAQGNVSLGDQSSDTIGFSGRINTDVVPSTDSARQLGSNSLRWSEVYGDNVTGTNFTAAGIMTATQYKGGTMTLTGGGNFGGNVDISGNLSVGGSITSINVDDFKSVSPLIEVGLEDVGDGTFQPPSFQTQYNTGIAMWYNPVGVSSDNAKAASIFAAVKPGGSFRVGFATVVAFSGSGTTDGVATVTNWADIEAKGLWINDCAGQSQVISCTGTERFLNNITVDGGSFS